MSEWPGNYSQNYALNENRTMKDLVSHLNTNNTTEQSVVEVADELL